MKAMVPQAGTTRTMELSRKPETEPIGKPRRDPGRIPAAQATARRAEGAIADTQLERFEQWRQRWNGSRHNLQDRLQALEVLLDALTDERHADAAVQSGSSS